MKPNLFTIATKELHQDAFITWLAAWADPSNEKYNAELSETGNKFLKALLSKHFDVTGLVIQRVRVNRQWERTDVDIDLNTNQGKYLILVEDKTFTKDSIGQLEKHVKIGKKRCAEDGAQLCCVYIKTGSESKKSLNAIKSKGFEPFNRKEFIAILNDFSEDGSDILTDFRSRLLIMQKAHDAFSATIVKKWNSECWMGFYQYLEDNMGIDNWELVNPRSGKQFWNAVLNWKDWYGFPVYLQIEETKLCFKISWVDSNIEDYSQSEIRNKWYQVIKNEAHEQNITTIRKPDRFGHGDYMTCAMVDQKNWLGSNDDLIDANGVIARLKYYKGFLNSILTEPRI